MTACRWDPFAVCEHRFSCLGPGATPEVRAKAAHSVAKAYEHDGVLRVTIANEIAPSSGEKLPAAINGARGRLRGCFVVVSSDGGQALASKTIAEALFEAREDLPSVALVETAVSGGFLVAAAASRAFALPSGRVGSVGVLRHSCFRGRVALFTAGTHKGRNAGLRAPHPADIELTGELAREAFEDLAQTQTEFIERLARYRGADPAHIRDRWGDARVGPAIEAVQDGLLDGVRDLAGAERVLLHMIEETSR